MKYKIQKKRSSAPTYNRKNKHSIDEDSFFERETKKKRKISNNREEDEEIQSSDSDEDNMSQGDSEKEEDEEEEDEFEAETVDETRKRLAQGVLQKLRAREKEMEEDDDDDDEEEGDARRSEREGERDSRVAKLLMQEQLEESGRVRRVIASRVQNPEATDEFRLLVKHRQSVTAVALSEDDLKGFSASKDGTIAHWDVECGKVEKYMWPTDEVLRSHGAKGPDGRVSKHSKQVLALAVSPDGRYLASGGVDRHVHLWDTRTREHVQAFPGHRGSVSCLTFRQGTSELFSGSFDRTVKIWNAEDRTYITTLFGHQSEVLTIDCLRKERLLTAGRDRSMQLFKVPEESRLIFRAPASSLECCCFISNDEFLSGSDDGNIELWGTLRKKPVHIVKNAHPTLDVHKNNDNSANISNGHLENGSLDNLSHNCSSVYSWVTSVSVCRGSDLAASGAGNGFVRLWATESESKVIRPLFTLPVTGFVNSLAFAKSGKFLVAGVGREPRLGRWGRIPGARDGVLIHPLKLSEDKRDRS